MKYELTMSSNRDNTKVNRIFNSDIPILIGDKVLGYVITSRNFIIDAEGDIDKIILDSFDYYRTNNQVFSYISKNPCIGCSDHSQQGLLEGGVEWTCSYLSCPFDYKNSRSIHSYRIWREIPD